MIASTPSTSNISWTQSLQFMRLWFQFRSAWSGWAIIVNDKKRYDRLWADMNGSLILILFPYSSWIPKPFKVRWLGETHQWPGPEIEDITEPIFHLGFHRGHPVYRMVTQGYNLCGSVSSSSWNGLHRQFKNIFVFRRVDSNRIWNLIWTFFPYHC